MSFAKAVVIIALALVVTWLPSPLSRLFGFYGSFVLTPIAMIFVLVAFGASIALMAPASPWAGVALAALVMATTGTLIVRSGLATASRRVPVMTFYVLMPPERAASFTVMLSKLLQDRGAETSLTQSLPFDNGVRYDTLGATKGILNVSVANTTITGASDARCLPPNAWPSPDPGQYYVMVQPSPPCVGRPEASALIDAIRHDLVSRGYDVRDRQAACAAVANDPRPPPR